jgi:hypothetical protein
VYTVGEERGASSSSSKLDHLTVDGKRKGGARRPAVNRLRNIRRGKSDPGKEVREPRGVLCPFSCSFISVA